MTCTSFSQARLVSSPSVFELGELRRVARVGEAAGAEAVAGADRDVVLRADLEDLVPVRVERVLLVVLDHPLRP